MLSRLKFEIAPLVEEILSQIPEKQWTSKVSTFFDPAIGGGQFVAGIEAKLRKYGHSDENIAQRVFGCETHERSVKFAIRKHSLVGTYYACNFLEEEWDMKFNNILGNPPYQFQQIGAKKSKVIWHLFVEKVFNISKEGGYVALIHPPQWRNPIGETKLANKILMNKQLLYISCHSYNDGQKLFGVGTAYDWYVAENIKPYTTTTIRFQDGKTSIIDVSKINFIPSGHYSEIQHLLAKDDEETVLFINDRSAYGNDKINMSPTKSSTFKHECVYTITKDKINLWYSNTTENGHFDQPKVIWSNGSGTRPIIDNKGIYGVMNFAYAIVDKIENLEHIKQALESEKMKELMKENLFTNGIYNNYIISKFKKDFWKDFI